MVEEWLSGRIEENSRAEGLGEKEPPRCAYFSASSFIFNGKMGDEADNELHNSRPGHTSAKWAFREKTIEAPPFSKRECEVHRGRMYYLRQLIVSVWKPLLHDAGNVWAAFVVSCHHLTRKLL